MVPNHGGERLALARTLGIRPEELLDFSANVNPYGPPPGVWAALAAALPLVAVYPEVDAAEATAAVAAYLGLQAEEVLLTNGGMEALAVAVAAVRPKAALVVEPCFAGYREVLAAAEVPTEVLVGDPEELLPRPLAAGTLVVLGSPVNPTGRLLPKAFLAALAADLAGGGSSLLVDEAFVDFLPDARRHTLRFATREHPNLVVAGSLTKFFTLPGLRLGYLVAPPGLAERVRRLRLPWNVNVLAQVAAQAAVADEAFARSSRDALATERRRLSGRLAALPGVAVAEGCANFLLLDLAGAGVPAAVLKERLLRRNILVRDASLFPGLGPCHVRVAVRTPAEDDRLVEALAAELGGRGPV